LMPVGVKVGKKRKGWVRNTEFGAKRCHRKQKGSEARGELLWGKKGG